MITKILLPQIVREFFLNLICNFMFFSGLCILVEKSLKQQQPVNITSLVTIPYIVKSLKSCQKCCNEKEPHSFIRFSIFPTGSKDNKNNSLFSLPQISSHTVTTITTKSLMMSNHIRNSYQFTPKRVNKANLLNNKW